MTILFFLLCLGLISGAIAHRKGRSGFAMWMLGAVCFPVGLIVALAMKPDRQALAERAWEKAAG